MTKFDEFCDSFWVGKAKTEEGCLEREDELRRLPVAVSQVLQRMCSFLQCPEGHVHYVDLETNAVAGTVESSLPPISFDHKRGRNIIGLEIRLGERPSRNQYPVWLRFEFVPIKHGGLEFQVGPDLFQVPEEEEKFFSRVAEAINHSLRQGYTAPTRTIVF
ncbi:MAG TPA: hypothetical protein VK395_13980 [Gemmataceae bacterium]|nr:hypothetical protein [Gemmataceae bacterium]